MKRIGHIFLEMVAIETLRRAHIAAKKAKGKKRLRSMAEFEEDLEKNLAALHESLVNGTWRMHPLKRMYRREGKKLRVIDYSTYWPDIVVLRAIGMTLGAKLNKSLIDETYAGIPGRGIHRAVRRLRRQLAEIPPDVPIFCYKIDVKKFYYSIPHDKLKRAVLHKVKDKQAVDLIFCIIDMLPGDIGLPVDTIMPVDVGIPIGTFTSPILANFYLSPIDHYVKSQGFIYCRYCDDIVIVGTDKNKLRALKDELHKRFSDLGLTIKPNEQIYHIERFGIDIGGYVVRRNTVIVRRSIERNFRKNARRFSNHPTAHGLRSLASQWGWFKPTMTGPRLWQKTLNVSHIKELNAKFKELTTNGNDHPKST